MRFIKLHSRRKVITKAQCMEYYMEEYRDKKIVFRDEQILNYRIVSGRVEIKTNGQ
jgi:hypothetical protein